MLVTWKYRFRDSFIDRFDPRARWIASFLVLAAILNFWDMRFLAIFFGLSLVQFRLTKLTWAETKRAWLFIMLLVVFIVGINAFIFGRGGPGDVLNAVPHYYAQRTFDFRWFTWTFSLTAEKVAFGFSQILRMLSIAILFFVIPWTMDPSQYGVTFSGMGFPYRFAFAMDLAFRFVPTLARDFQITLDAQRARGFEIDKLEGGVFATIRRVAPLIVPVTMNAIVAGEDIVNAMDMRCFGVTERTWIDKLSYSRHDYALIGFAVLVLAASLIVHHGFGIGNFWVPPFLIDLASPA
jgi:energy-coupling factor transport system permease protein